MEMTKQRDFSTLSPKQNMNIWKINLIPSQPLHLNVHFSLAGIFFLLLFFLILYHFNLFTDPPDCAGHFFTPPPLLSTLI